MIIQAARNAASDLFDPEFRGALWKALGLTIVLFFFTWVVLEFLITTLLMPLLGPWPWVSTAILWILGTGMVIGAGYLLAPVTALFAGFFLDDIAKGIEDRHYPHDPAGVPLPISKSAVMGIKFALFVLAANLLALLMVLFLGLNVIVFLVLNGLLLGREYFTFAAMRFLPEQDVIEMRREHSSTIFLAGLIIAGFVAVPILNFLTPIFAVGMMVHLFKNIVGSRPIDTEPGSASITA